MAYLQLTYELTSALTLQLPVTGTNITVDWINNGTTSSATSYSFSAGTYSIKIYGTNLWLNHSNKNGAPYLISCDSFGNVNNLYNAFNNCTKLISVPLTVPSVTNMASMFFGASRFNGNISQWDVSQVINMFSMFKGASAFNKNISGWDVSRVTNMSNMFYSAITFNKNISGWDVSRVIDMSYMFYYAYSFNSDISTWKIGMNVTGTINMSSMFKNAIAFNRNINYVSSSGAWDVGKVTDMTSMFQGASSFNGDISAWNVGKVTNMSSMFQGATAFNGNINSWTISNTAITTNMFTVTQTTSTVNTIPVVNTLSINGVSNTNITTKSQLNIIENYLKGNHFIKQSHVPLTIPSSVFTNVDTSYSKVNQIYIIAAPSNSVLPLSSFLSTPTTLFVLPTTNNPIILSDGGITVTIVSNETASYINGNLFVLGSTQTVGSYTIQMVANGSTAILITPFISVITVTPSSARCIGTFRAGTTTLGSDTVSRDQSFSAGRAMVVQKVEQNRIPKVGVMDSSQRTSLRVASLGNLRTQFATRNGNDVKHALIRTRNAGAVAPKKKNAAKGSANSTIPF